MYDSVHIFLFLSVHLLYPFFTWMGSFEESICHLWDANSCFFKKFWISSPTSLYDQGNAKTPNEKEWLIIFLRLVWAHCFNSWTVTISASVAITNCFGYILLCCKYYSNPIMNLCGSQLSTVHFVLNVQMLWVYLCMCCVCRWLNFSKPIYPHLISFLSKRMYLVHEAFTNMGYAIFVTQTLSLSGRKWTTLPLYQSMSSNSVI